MDRIHHEEEEKREEEGGSKKEVMSFLLCRHISDDTNWMSKQRSHTQDKRSDSPTSDWRSPPPAPLLLVRDCLR